MYYIHVCNLSTIEVYRLNSSKLLTDDEKYQISKFLKTVKGNTAPLIEPRAALFMR